MTKGIKLWLVGALFIAMPALCADRGIQLRSGEMGLGDFLEMVSDRLDLQIDASGLDMSSGKFVVPDTGPLSPDRAKALVLSALYLQGYTWIHDGVTDLYRIMRLRDARDQETPMITDAAQLPDSDLLVTYFMHHEYVSPEYVARIARSFMPANSRIIPEEGTNSVLITDSSRNILKLKKLIQQIDTPQNAKESADWLDNLAKKMEGDCPELAATNHTPQPGILIALFSLIGLVIGFLVRGYVIRRIEGGL
jgi:type II secretory pathway component GspD/PulD (secretin)